MKEIKEFLASIPKSLAWVVLIGLPILILVISYFSISNSEIRLKNSFDAAVSKRTTQYDNMWKTWAGKAQIAVKNDSAFQNIVNIQMNGQKDGENVTWKWIQQSNPSASFGQVQALYSDLSRCIEAKRDEFMECETELQDLNREHEDMLSVAPSSWFLSSRKHFVYKPITSTRTDDVIKTGKDDNTKVF